MGNTYEYLHDEPYIYKSFCPGWNFTFNEISAAFWEAKATNNYGQEVSCQGMEVHKKIESYAIDISLRMTNNLGKFLYDLFYGKAKLKSEHKSNYNFTFEYNENVSGSWVITFRNYRIVWDGRDKSLRLDENINNWTKIELIEFDKITMESICNLFTYL